MDERLDDNMEMSRIIRSIRGRDPGSDDIDLGFGFLNRDAGLEMRDDSPVLRNKGAAHHVDDAGIARHPKIRASPRKTQRHDPDERAANAVQREGFADDAWVGAKLICPCRVAKDEDGRRSRLIVGGFEPAAEKRSDAEEFERTRRYEVGGEVAVVFPRVVDHIDLAV